MKYYKPALRKGCRLFHTTCANKDIKSYFYYLY
jgi:hypothetical protein